MDLDRLEAIGADAQQKGSLKVVERSFVLDDGTASMRCEWRCCGCAARDYPGESRRWTGARPPSAAPWDATTGASRSIHVASLRRAREEELPLWTLLTPLRVGLPVTVLVTARRRRAGGVYYTAVFCAIDARS